MKPKYALDGKGEFMFKTGIVLVRGQINPIEAGMTLRQLRWVTRLFDRETSGTIRALQIFEAIDGYARSSGRKLKKSRFALRRPAADAFPEPLDDFVVHLVSTIIREFRPVVASQESYR